MTELFLYKIIKMLWKLFINKEADKNIEIGTDIAQPANSTIVPVTVQIKSIDWSNKDCAITTHFTVGDAITLHSWNKLATEEDGLTEDGKQKLIALCNKMEEVRKILGCSINVHCMYRSQKYNQEVVKAIPNDVHAQFLACDFDTNGCHTIDEVHSILEPILDQLGVRMERNTPTWIHIDLHPVIHSRYFLA